MTKKQKKMLKQIIISSIFVIIYAIVFHLFEVHKYIQFALYMIPFIIVGGGILKKALTGIMNKQVFDENFLMAVATVGAIVLGEYQEGVAVMLFYQIGELFQAVAVGKSRRNIAQLMDIRPDYANIYVDGELEQVDADKVETGSTIVVKMGERIPIDGVIIEGKSAIDTTALTGESKLQDVQEGSEVLSGSINISGLIKVRTTKLFGESTASKILELVENSSMKKSRSENFITKFARYYTPIVCILAFSIAVFVPIIRIAMGNEPLWTTWITRALLFLVMSCPCALVISIPLSFFGGIGGASSKGILIKGANYLETLSQAKYVVFDKTGTLTKGTFEVAKVYLAGTTSEGKLLTDDSTQSGNNEGGVNISEEELLKYAAHAEVNSNHPISKSLCMAYGQNIDNTQISDVSEIAGYGVRAKVFGKEVAVGNAKLMSKLGISYEEIDEIGTITYVAIEGVYAGAFLISDVVKPTSKNAIRNIKKLGIKNVTMLTGDAKNIADSIADSLGITDVKSELLPADKVAMVEELFANKKENEKIVFVGDGINDAPVLARADIGIAMGALGSDAAIEAADIVLMDDNPEKIALAMKISRKTLAIVKQNIVFALTVKIACLILGAFGIANMWTAIFADVGVMVIAVVNATRALHVKNV